MGLSSGDPTGWFEQLYAEAREGRAIVPWDGREPNRHLVEWAAREQITGDGRRAIVVGCGHGDDAEFIARLGFATTAFDISATAVAGARERFPDSAVHYRVADAFDPPADWRHAFDLVVEIYTLQALPEAPRAQAAAGITGMLAPGGTLLVIAARRDDAAPYPPPPWPLRRSDLDALAVGDVHATRIEELADAGRWRAEFRRSPA